MIFLSLFLSLCTARVKPESPPRYDRHVFMSHNKVLLYQAKWGSYSILVKPIADHEEDYGYYSPQEVLIYNRRGNIVRRLRGGWVMKVETVRLRGKSSQDLHVTYFSGGAYCCESDAFLTYAGGYVHNLAVVYGFSEGVHELKDLDNDGRPEIVFYNPVLLNFSGYHFHRPYLVATVLKWNGKRYVNATHRFPDYSLYEARFFQAEILKDVKDRAYPSPWWQIEDEVACVYANMLAVGRGEEAKKWLRSHLPKLAERWLPKYDKEMRRLICSGTLHNVRTYLKGNINMNRHPVKYHNRI